MKAFELHTLQGTQWRIDAIFDDQSLAISEAARMAKGKTHECVRVIEELFDEESKKTVTRTIYRGGGVKQQANAAKLETNKKPAASASQGSLGNEVVRNEQPLSRPKRSGIFIPVIVLVFLLSGGAAAMLSLHYLALAS